MKTKELLFGACLCMFTACNMPEKGMDVDVYEALDYCDAQVQRTLTELKAAEGTIDYSMMPRNIMDSLNTWHCRKATKDEWCSGFWPGVLWYDYEYTGKTTIKEEAEKFTEPLKFLSQIPAYDHDLGFLIFCSYGNGYRLTHNPEYKQVILDTADSLATLFRPRVGTILSWPRNIEMFGGHNTIMDNMINLEMLFWAAKNGGNPYLADIAVSHADKTMKYQFRPDYTSYHVAVYDTLTGDFIKGVTHQGYADNTMWARGQAWAIYGYTMAYRETHRQDFLDMAVHTADFWLNHPNLPEDGIPYWDFNAGQEDYVPDWNYDPEIFKVVPRDASAAAIVASAFLELSGYVTDGKKYSAAAAHILKSLSSPAYLAEPGTNCNFILMHSVGSIPHGEEIDVPLIYADYYYLEALMRYKNM